MWTLRSHPRLHRHQRGLQIMSALDDELRDLMRFAAQRSMLPAFFASPLPRNEGRDERGVDDPVTIVDREVEAFLTEALTRLAARRGGGGRGSRPHADPEVLKALSGQVPGSSIHSMASGQFRRGQGTLRYHRCARRCGPRSGGVGSMIPCANRFCHARAGEVIIPRAPFVNGTRITARTTGAAQPVTAVSRIFLTPEQSAMVDAKLAPALHAGGHPALRCRAISAPRTGRERRFQFQAHLRMGSCSRRAMAQRGGRQSRALSTAANTGWTNRNKPGLVGASSPAIWDEIRSRRVAGLSFTARLRSTPSTGSWARRRPCGRPPHRS